MTWVVAAWTGSLLAGFLAGGAPCGGADNCCAQEDYPGAGVLGLLPDALLGGTDQFGGGGGADAGSGSCCGDAPNSIDTQRYPGIK